MNWSSVALVSSLAVALPTLAHAATPKPTPAPETACKGVPEAQWSGAPLTDPQDIRAVQEVKTEPPASETETVVARAGARILLRAQPGMTVEWLQQVAECHLARVGAASARVAASPLDVKGASVAVHSAGDGFAVEITSADRKAAKEILARAQALVPRGTDKR
jgi:hypothetical protein